MNPGQDLYSLVLPLGTATVTCTSAPPTLDIWHWALLPETLHLCVQTATWQLSAGLLPHTVIFISRSRSCALVDWHCLGCRRGSGSAFLVFSASGVKAWLCFTRLQIPLSQVHRMERQKNECPLPMIRTPQSPQKEIEVGMEFAPKWTWWHLVCANADYQ